MPEKLIRIVWRCSELGVIGCCPGGQKPPKVQCGRAGLPREAAATVPIAMPAPTSNATLISKERVRFCLAGAIAAPAGLDAGTPSGLKYGAAAVPTGAGVLFCWSVGAVCGVRDCPLCEVPGAAVGFAGAAGV